MKLLRIFCVLSLVLAITIAANARDESALVVKWPADKPQIKLVFGKFLREEMGGGESKYTCEVTIENLTGILVPRAAFTLYFADKGSVRIGEGLLQVSDLEPHQSARVELKFAAYGIPASVSLLAKKTIPLRVISSPPGASLKVDGQDAGTTPVMVRLTVGTHQLNLTKEGYAPGSTPLEVTPDELPGGSITVELGGLSRDTIELRDGSTLMGDVLSMSLAEVVVRVDGRDQSYPRNQIKKIMLVERVTTEQAPLVPQVPATQK